MAYTIKDILGKLVELEKEMSTIYYDMSKTNDEKFESFKVLAKVMGNEEKKHSVYFKQIIDSIGERRGGEIDYFTYDKISQRMYEFKSRINIPKMDKMDDLIKFIIDFEKENLALLLDIKGKLVMNSKDTQKYSYQILSLLIDEEKKHVRNLEPYCK